MGTRALVGLVAGVALLGVSASCAKQSAGYAREYELGRYEAALAMSQREAMARSGSRQDHAALVAGLSAHALALDDVAERWLSPLTSSRDKEIAGRASAALGLMERRRGNHAEAAELLGRAAESIEGYDGRRAQELAGDSLLAARRGDSSSRDHYNGQAMGTNADRSAFAARLPGGAFCVQIGAFGSRANAQLAADRTRWRADRLDIGEPRIVVGADTQGRTLYIVQVGRFASRDQAESVRRQLGGDGLIAYVSE
jgi:hypothetical protein